MGTIFVPALYVHSTHSVVWIEGAPILTCVHKSIPDIFMDCHMMVAEPEKVERLPASFYPSLNLMFHDSG